MTFSHLFLLQPVICRALYSQELQQARQQQTLGDLRKALSEVKLNAQKRLLDYQREVTIADKDVAAAEKKLLKSKSFSEKNHDHKHR